MVFRKGLFAAMAEHAVERLQGKIAVRHRAQQANAMHIVVEIAPGLTRRRRMAMIHIGKRVFPLVAKRSMPHVVTQGDGLDERDVQAQGGADLA